MHCIFIPLHQSLVSMISLYVPDLCLCFQHISLLGYLPVLVSEAAAFDCANHGRLKPQPRLASPSRRALSQPPPRRLLTMLTDDEAPVSVALLPPDDPLTCILA